MLKLMCLKVTLCLFRLVNKLSKALFRYSFHSGYIRDQLRASINYNCCVHQCNILFRAQMMEVAQPEYSNFLLRHDSYKNPKVLLEDDISLVGFDRSRALFVRTPPNFDVYSSEHNAFMFITQFKEAIQLLSMPIEHFLTFSKQEVPQTPSMNVILLSNTGRCGSTLLAQMMEEIPYMLSMSEPDGLTASHPGFIKEKKISYSSEEVTAAMMRVQCKPLKSRRVDHILIKPRSVCVSQMKCILESCPWVRHVFMYREPRKNISSYMAMSEMMPFWAMGLFMKKFSQVIFTILQEGDSAFVAAMQESQARFDKRPDLFYLMCQYWACQMRCYKDTRDALGDPDRIKPLIYEELLAEPLTVMSELLAHCAIPVDHAKDTLKAMSKDSQRNTAISTESLKKAKREISEEQLLVMDEVFALYELPKVEEYQPGQFPSI